MEKAVAINGSPRMEKGNTALLLNAFLQGITRGGCEVENYYASRMNIKPCNCGTMYCWRTPGKCCHLDDMQALYDALKSAEIMIIATPVYSPLPGEMQNVINRLCPLIEPDLVKREGRTRARFREDVAIRKMVLVAVGGWWELENLDRVVNIIEELAETCSCQFSGALLRPHASAMRSAGNLTPDGEAVLFAAQQAGFELITEGKMNDTTLENISRPLVAEEDW